MHNRVGEDEAAYVVEGNLGAILRVKTYLSRGSETAIVKGSLVQ